ncbi:hypothetical protein [Blastococcus sp. KM273129]|uniref:hypothetical protein n=1 Tax=Blastococcus sp. KM273129 TaxID=2570315 RepID=UPI001F4840B5|nr:hypothetical protein [Blastococcus sp. KM273129]MCF6735235.1 hypothetical protein [Blastococcus sp. KM273129]
MTTNSRSLSDTDDPTYDSISGASVEAARAVRRHLAIVPSLAPTAAEARPDRLDATAEPALRRGGVAVIGPSRVLRASLSGRDGSDLGVLTHALVTTHAPLLATVPPEELLGRMHGLARNLLDANWNRRRVVAAEAVSLAHKYLTRLAPTAPWRLLAVEYQTGDGTVDLAWEHVESGRVLFDELKTSRIATRKVPEGWLHQARRYAAAGAAQHPSLFTGVRLLPLNRMHLARFVGLNGLTARLSPTTFEPLREKGGVA